MLYYMNNRSLSVKNSNPRNRVRKINKNVIEIKKSIKTNRKGLHKRRTNRKSNKRSNKRNKTRTYSS